MGVLYKQNAIQTPAHNDLWVHLRSAILHVYNESTIMIFVAIQAPTVSGLLQRR